MKDLIRKIVLLALLAVAASYLWSHRDRIGNLSNNNVRIQGDWHRVNMNFKQAPVYTFSAGIISLEGEEWASYRLLQGPRIEVATAGEYVIYELDFTDDDNMVWSKRIDEKLVPSMHWRR